MEAAKAAVFKHLSRDGQHETEVQEHVKPAVQHETVQPTQHEKVYRPMDKEVHQEHHHTTVQPIKDREVLPEKHTHVNENTEHKQFRHGDHDRIHDTVSQEHARLGLTEHTREVGSTTRTQAEAPTATGEHVHHHIHEHVQPVINKETIQPHVVHRTAPVHEVHHHEPQHHSATTLPPVSIDEFKKQGGHVTGEPGVRRDEFLGEPKPLESGYIGGHGARGTTHLTRPEGDVDGDHGGIGTHHNHATHGSGTHNELGSTHGHDHSHSREAGSNLVNADGTRGTHAGTGSHTGTSSHTPGTGRVSPTSSTSTHKKPSLMDKLNPKVDSNGDGKAGFMK